MTIHPHDSGFVLRCDTPECKAVMPVEPGSIGQTIAATGWRRLPAPENESGSNLHIPQHACPECAGEVTSHQPWRVA